MTPHKQQLAILKLLGKSITRRKNKQGYSILPCPLCDSMDVKLSDCGYTTYNPGKAICEDCGHKVMVMHVETEKDMIPIWNNHCRSRLLPDLNDLNVMRRVAMELAHQRWYWYSKYQSSLTKIVAIANSHPDKEQSIFDIDATGPQRAEALIRAADMWED